MVSTGLAGRAQNLPDTVRSGGYVFAKEWVNHLDNKGTEWALGNWTFDSNLCEFRSENVSFSNGIMELTLSAKDSSNMGDNSDKPYWGAEYYSTSEYQYGRYVANMKPNSPSGVITSFFLIHTDNDTPEWYEIDIEFVGNTDSVQFALHWINEQGTKKSTSKVVDLSLDAGQEYHQWIIEWTPDHITYYIDSTKLHSFTDASLINEQEHPQSIRMNYWISNSEAWAGAFDSTRLPHSTAYDYISYYSLQQQPTGINNTHKNQSLTIHPNPFESTFKLNTQHPFPIKYQLYSSQGKLVREGKTHQPELAFPNLQKGVYTIVFKTPAKNYRKKLIKE